MDTFLSIYQWDKLKCIVLYTNKTSKYFYANQLFANNNRSANEGKKTSKKRQNWDRLPIKQFQPDKPKQVLRSCRRMDQPESYLLKLLNPSKDIVFGSDRTIHEEHFDYCTIAIKMFQGRDKLIK